ncbi:MAG: hypothetical protein JWP57_3519 [Spirosoma sp.]|nr:hypothetical protein [Spirosoma sp.]
MNLFLSLLLSAVSVAATAQHSRQSTTHTQINDDGKTLSVRVEGEVDGRTINYQHTFDVACLSGMAKDGLKRRILDSLGIGEAPNLPYHRFSRAATTGMTPQRFGETSRGLAGGPTQNR